MIRHVPEEFIHYIWRLKLFDFSILKTTRLRPLQILDFGFHNPNAGPDFLDGKILLDGVTWIGHFEIHIKSSDWYKHRHHLDPNYDNVVLHIVMEEDRLVNRKDDTIIPCLNISRLIQKHSLKKYHSLKSSLDWVPCTNLIQDVPDITIKSTLERMIAERLENKSIGISKKLKSCKYDWSEVIYKRLAWSLGLSVNADTFEALAHSLPLRVVFREKDSLLKLEALLFGQSGLLPAGSREAYVQSLKKEYRILRSKYKLNPIKAIMWKFSRLRPPSFPSFRIAQFAKILFRIDRLDQILSFSSREEIMEFFNFKLNGYWSNHYRFGIASSNTNVMLGHEKINSILINAIAPLLFAYSKIYDVNSLRDRAITLLLTTPPEDNIIIRKWASLQIKANNAADTQGLIHLKKSYCSKGLCLNCSIGHKVLN